MYTTNSLYQTNFAIATQVHLYKTAKALEVTIKFLDHLLQYGYIHKSYNLVSSNILLCSRLLIPGVTYRTQVP